MEEQEAVVVEEKQMTDHQRWWKKQNADRVVHRKRKIAETRDISAYTLHEFLKELSDAQEEGFIYNQWDAPYAGYMIGNLMYAKLIKYFPDEPEVPKEIPPELAEIQTKFADQAGAAAKEFAEPPKRKRGIFKKD